MGSKKVGLFFGSFNPLHIGHMILANYFVEETDLDEVWFVVSPQNPFKENSTLLNEIHRYAIVERTIEEDLRFKVSKIEFDLPKPSYTIDTLAHLTERYPTIEFTLIMGQDNLVHLHKWKNSDVLVETYRIFVYPRKHEAQNKWVSNPNICIVNAPEIEISASFIRASIKSGKDVSWFLPKKAWDYINEMNFYK